MLHQRLASSAVLLTVVFGLLYLDYQFPVGALWLIPLLLFFAIGTAIDLTRMWSQAGYPVRSMSARFCVGFVVLTSCLPLLWTLSGEPYPADCVVGRLGWIAVGSVIALAIALGVEMYFFESNASKSAAHAMSTTFAVLYIGIPMSFLVAIRGMGSAHWGLAAVISLVAATKIADAGAYFTGKAFGRRKLIPRLSPGKTIEGSIGGIAASIAMSFAVFSWLIPWMVDSPADYPWWGPILFGTLCSTCGMFGDLAESLMKRDAGTKDSGNLLPGLGGIWDVSDSLIAAALPGFLCFAAGAAGTIH
ncbi:MAG: phosphatidate cytidylyltransferase [Pirellulaceae bacterium]